MNQKTLKQKIVEILYEEADENEFGESFVMLQESIVVDRLLSLFESYQAEQIKVIEEKQNAISMLYGMKVKLNPYVPDDEIWIGTEKSKIKLKIKKNDNE